MSREERQGLLHEGSGSAVGSAYVEVIFDNSDHRFPTDFKEVTLRRTIGLKKDEYSVDRKVVTKKDVLNLLDAAGFSKSNPYYIVPQGRVTALTNMKESDRLNLLKEVAGTQVYETRRAESLKIMTETNNKREKIDELLEYIKERLSELEEEKEELRGYQERDRERRCLEYAYHYREQVTIQETLEEIDSARQGGLDTTDSSRAELAESKRAIAKVDAEMHKLQREMELLQIDRRQLDEDRRECAKTLAKVELKHKSLKEGQSAREQSREQYVAELAAVRAEISTKESELAKIIPKYNKTKSKEDEIRRNLDSAESTRSRLFAKQSRGSRFKNKSERDAYLRGEIEELSNTIAQQKANKIDADEEVARVQQFIAQEEQEATNLRARINNWKDNRDELGEDATQKHDKLDRLNDERKLLRREEEKLASHIANARHEKDQAEKELRHTMDRDVARGLASIRRMKQDHDIPGTYGTVADLLEVSDAYRVAVEQTAGARLFNYVVDNEETATRLLNTLQKNQGGRVTCLPLTQLRYREAKMPKAHDAVPLLSKITYDPKYERAFQRIFGNTVVCPNLQIASQYSRSHNVDSITPEGDTTNRRGALSGGWIDPQKSRIRAVRAANKWRDEYERLTQQSLDMRKQIQLKDQEITGAMAELQKAEQRVRQFDDGLEPAKSELRNKMAHLEAERSHLDSAIKRRDAVDRNMNTFIGDREAHEAELQTDFKKSLTAAEEQQLEELSNTTLQLQKQWNELSTTRRELESRKSLLEADLRQNLQLKLDQLNGQGFEELASGTSSEGLQDVQRELKKAQKASKAVEADLREIEARFEQLTQQSESLANDKATREMAQAELAHRIEKQQKRIEKNLAKKGILTNQLAECAKNIRDLGVLPEEAFDKYENMETKTVSDRNRASMSALIC
jgi:structural maintenance of chromosome 3 (chondroitin sulfate proteoglycan 6)